MNLDCVGITDPPEYDTRMELDDAPEQLGDDFTLSAEDDAKITFAAQRGPRAVRMARAGDADAMADLKRLHITRWEVGR